MSKQRQLRVSGLANIALLLGQSAAVATVQQSAPPAAKDSKEAIVLKTLGNLQSFDIYGTAKEAVEVSANNRRCIEAAVRAAHSLGHAEALNQNSRVEELLHKQYESRNHLTMPAVVAAVMEQCGMEAMTLDLGMVATVFMRTRIHYVLDDGIDNLGGVMQFRLEHKADIDGAAPDTTFSLEA